MVKYRKADEITVDGNAARGVVFAVGITVLGATVLSGIGYGVYEVGWDVKRSNVNRTAQINRESLAFQEGLIADINQKLTDEANLTSVIAETTDQTQRVALTAQRKALDNTTCTDWHQITPGYRGSLDTDQQQTLTQMCATGYYQP